MSDTEHNGLGGTAEDDALLNDPLETGEALDDAAAVPASEKRKYTEEQNPALDSDNESILSDLDEEDFQNYNDPDPEPEEPIPIDGDTVQQIGKFKKQRDDSDRPREKKEKRRREKRRRDYSDDEVATAPQPEIELTAEERSRMELDKKIDEALKTSRKKKKRKNDHDLDKMDDETIQNLCGAMCEAADRDVDAVALGRPATHKIAMLEDVRQILTRRDLLNVALDGEILTGIRRWLEPLPNKALPAYSVQKLMFELLGKLRPDVTNLRESGIGKIVMFYTKDVRPILSIKRQADRLVREWARPILGRSDDYRSREVPTESSESRNSMPVRSRHDDEDDRHNPLAQPRRDTNRARAPMPSTTSYEVAPKSRVFSGLSAYAKPIGSAGDDMVRRLKAKKQQQRGKGGKSGLKIG